ncbi:hypothetical protein BJP36_36500 [Moorena producens JHB]|uniref:Uncharacterized protein n=1 Tax=Moorena producens (strain JHB) TaxID=1454205 RepID=A0A9Q9SU04_MOOP1|nr:hypothetical protein [Moorena producens]WAN69593.1 hypothetical protein BJP36_36500 [Moorena producens JHB]
MIGNGQLLIAVSNLIRYRAFFPDSRFPIPDSRFPIPDSRFPFPSWEGLGVGSDSRFPIPDSRFPTPDSRLPIPDSLLPTPLPPKGI